MRCRRSEGLVYSLQAALCSYGIKAILCDVDGGVGGHKAEAAPTLAHLVKYPERLMDMQSSGM